MDGSPLVRSEAAAALDPVYSDTVGRYFHDILSTKGLRQHRALVKIAADGQARYDTQILVSLLMCGSIEIRESAAEALDSLEWVTQSSKERAAKIFWLGRFGEAIEIDRSSLDLLLFVIESHDNLVTRLRAYRVAESVEVGRITNATRKDLIEEVASEIRRLYSRTKSVYYPGTYEYEQDGQTYHYVSHASIHVPGPAPDSRTEEEADPDIAGIQELSVGIPKSLIDAVAQHSGDAKLYVSDG